MHWFMKRIEKGYFETINPYNRAKKIIDASCDNIHSIVFWSKNFRPFLEMNAGEQLKRKGYNLFFNFTINSRSELLEPNIPPLEDRLSQLEELCMRFTPETINWRFDPICFFRSDNNKANFNKNTNIYKHHNYNKNYNSDIKNYSPIENNLSDFTQIADKAQQCGISRCITSFTDNYAKIEKRINYLINKGEKPPVIIYPDNSEKSKIILWMEHLLKTKQISLFTCCEKDILALLPKESSVLPSACVPGKLLKQIFGGNPETKRDYGQRAKKGCQCTKSIDIGSYDLHPCHHNCLFCYANPAIDKEIKMKNAKHNG